MLNEEYRHLEFLPQPCDKVHKVLSFLRVHACCRLIQQQELRSGSQRTGNLQTALRAIGQILRCFSRQIIEAEYLQQLVGFDIGSDFIFHISADAQSGLKKVVSYVLMEGNLYIVQYGKLRKQAYILKGTGHSPGSYIRGLHTGHILTAELDSSGGGSVYAGQQVESRGLAGTVGADESDKLAFVYVHIEIVNSCKTAENDRALPPLPLSSVSIPIAFFASGDIFFRYLKRGRFVIST